MVIIIAVVCVAFNLYRTVEVGDKLKKLLENPDIFSDFERLSYWENRFCNAIAIATFLAWIKVSKKNYLLEEEFKLSALELQTIHSL